METASEIDEKIHRDMFLTSAFLTSASNCRGRRRRSSGEMRSTPNSSARVLLFPLGRSARSL